jgi:hypothetical protein
VRARGRRAFVALAILVVAGGALGYAVWKAPRFDLVPIARAFLVDLDEGRHLQALKGSLVQDRWDLVGLFESNAARQRRLGKLLRLEAAGPEEEVTFQARFAHVSGKRVRLRGTFERGTEEMVFTFARRGATWVVRDFELLSPDPVDQPSFEKHLRRIAGETVDQIANRNWPDVYHRLARADRIAEPLDAWAPRMAAPMEGVGARRTIEERQWVFADGRATYGARILFENARRDVEIELGFDRSEGRAVILRLALLP